jgi:Fis family transcriptional regulator
MPIDVYQLVLNEVEPPLLDAVMEFTNNNQSKASSILGINRTTFRTKLKKYTKKMQLNLKDKVRKAMKGYFAQLDQKNMPINVYQLVFNEVEPPLLHAVMKFANNNQSKAARILGINRTTFRTKLKKYNIK